MMRFEYSQYLFLILSIPICLLVFYYLNQQKARLALLWKNSESLKAITSHNLTDTTMYRYIVFAFYGLMISIALANPQWGVSEEEARGKFANVYVALDISNSMNANDVSPSRLAVAKKYATDLITALKGNNIGLVFFAGFAYLQMPLTSDYGAAVMMANVANTNFAGSQGTNIDDVASLVKKANDKIGSKNNFLIIITDGEDLENGSLNSIASLANDGTYIYSIGVGTSEGGYIPQGGGYKKDEDGQLVKTSLNIQLINEIAKLGNGRAFSISDETSIKTIAADVAKEAVDSGKRRSFSSYHSYFQFFIILALIAAIMEYYLNKKHFLKNA